MGRRFIRTGSGLDTNKTWRSRWYADRDYAKLLHEDLALRGDLKKRFAHAGCRRFEIERAANKLKLDIHTSPTGHHHRPEGDGSRQTQDRDSEAHQPRGLH